MKLSLLIEAMTTTLKPGDAVILKKELSLPSSDRPTRMIISIDLKKFTARCVWDEDHGHLHCEDEIPLDALMLDPEYLDL